MPLIAQSFEEGDQTLLTMSFSLGMADVIFHIIQSNAFNSRHLKGQNGKNCEEQGKTEFEHLYF